jgi:hypothetical protein
MDIRAYFQKVRAAEREIKEPYVIVVSLETSEGGKPGQATEVSRASAAQLIIDNRVRLATSEERAAFYKEGQDALVAAQEALMASKIQLTVVSDTINRAGKRPEKG